MPAAGVDRSADEAPSWRAASTNFPPCPPRFEVVEGQGPPLMARPLSGEKDTFCMGAQGHEISSLGSIVLQQLLEVLPLRSKLTGVDSPSDLFPLPTSRDRFEGLWPDKSPRVLDWMVCMVTSLNCYWGSCFGVDRDFSDTQVMVLNRLVLEVERFCDLGLRTVVSPFSKSGPSTMTIKAMRSRLLSGFHGRISSRPCQRKLEQCHSTRCAPGDVESMCCLLTHTSNLRMFGAVSRVLESWLKIKIGVQCALDWSTLGFVVSLSANKCSKPGVDHS